MACPVSCCFTLGWVFVPFYLRSNVFTMPEFLERRSRPQLQPCTSPSVSIIAYILTKIYVHLWAGRDRASSAWSAWASDDRPRSSLVIATGIYTIAGGLGAVIYTELFQTLILLTGAVALTLIGISRSGRVRRPARGAARDYFHMIKGVD